MPVIGQCPAGYEKSRHQHPPTQAGRWREDREFQRRSAPKGQRPSKKEGKARPDGLHLEELGRADHGSCEEIGKENEKHGRSFGPSSWGQASAFPVQNVKTANLNGRATTQICDRSKGPDLQKRRSRSYLYARKEYISFMTDGAGCAQIRLGSAQAIFLDLDMLSLSITRGGRDAG